MSEAEHRERRGRRWGVPVAEVVLVAAVWLSLRLAGGAPGVGPEMNASPADFTGELDGFESEWYLPDDELLGFIEVAGGPFTMGSDPALDRLAFDIERWSPTEPQGVVEVPTFYMGRYEVTVAQYAAFVRRSGHAVVEPAALDAPPDHPVANVSWTDALAYARWLDEELRTGEATPPAVSALLSEGWRITLPTEAQWEKAARGDDGRIYPWGEEPRQDRAVFGTNNVHQCAAT